MDEILETIEAMLETHPELDCIDQIQFERLGSNKLIVKFDSDSKYLVTISELEVD